MNTAYTFGAILSFLFEKQSKAYAWYDDVSIAKEKDDRAQKTFQSKQLCWLAGKVGV